MGMCRGNGSSLGRWVLSALVFNLGALGCSEDPVTTVAVRSLEQSGTAAFLCLSWDDKQNPGRPMDQCARFTGAEGEDPGSLYAFVTQTTRGEVAVIDLTLGEVVDLNKAKPGFNFVPSGGNPVDIVATPGGTATFLGSAEANREGIWILPSRTIVQHSLQLTSFAACALPAAPGAMAMLIQPTPKETTPSTCNQTPYEDQEHPNGDLSLETENQGTPKLVVTLPDLGAVAVMDAQQLLDQPAGSFRACPIERWVALQVDLPPALPQQRTPEGGFPPGTSADGSTCALTEPPSLTTQSGFVPRPSGLAYDANSQRLYIADEDAPVIHVLDTSSPCELTELSPLLPMSAARPERVVITRKLAVSPATSKGKQFLYATDFLDGSLMVFDVSLDSTDRTPLIRPHAWRSPFQPQDRLTFSVPVRDIEFVLRDRPEPDPNTGVSAVGIACDPDDDASIGARYRTSSDFSEGARPYYLRGIFATIALTNGQIAIVDVEDFDAPCRRPKESNACEGETLSSYEGASGEISCGVVETHQPRSSAFLHATDNAKGWVTGLQSYPILAQGTSVLPTDQTPEGMMHPKLLAPFTQNVPLLVGGRLVDDLNTDPSTADKNSLLFDHREPRVHFEQDWKVTFEGSLPGFNGRVGRFDPRSDEYGRTSFLDSGAFFCDRGVHDIAAAQSVASSKGIDTSGVNASWALEHVDVVQITEDFLDENDPYWGSVSGRCSWLQCRETFGLVQDPKTTRDLPIVEARQGALIVDGVYDFVRCCFPSLVSYTVRPRKQWVVTGGTAGFLHRVVPDPSSGRCIDSCDPNRSLLDARAFERQIGQSPPVFDDPDVFRNPAMQFVVWAGQSESERGMTFSFRQNNGFSPLLINLAASTTFVQPQSLQLAPTGELAMTDGSSQGLVLISLNSLDISRTFF